MQVSEASTAKTRSKDALRVKIPRNEIDNDRVLGYASRVSEHPQPARQTPRDYDGPKAFRDHPGVATKERTERSEVLGVRPMVDEVESNGGQPYPVDSGFDLASASALGVSSGGAEITA